MLTLVLHRVPAAIVVLLFLVAAVPAAQDDRRNVILITLDGARHQEMFAGLDPDVLQSTLGKEQRLEQQPVYKRLWAETPAARRLKLMPFFWTKLMTSHGSIAGNRAIGSRVALTNRHWFSYPGYAEMLLGVAHDDRIRSNDPVRTPFPTVLEFLQSQLKLSREGVAVFASWSVFDAIAESRENTMTVNAGFERSSLPHPDARRLSDLQFETPTPWDSVRHDVYTFRLAMAHLQTHKPRVLYLALGETDDWAHDGRYDRVLAAYERTDGYLRELWEWLESQPEYKGRTNILITTDHGRGRTPGDWRHHGADHAGSDETWMAVVGPATDRRGEWRDHDSIATASVAATLIEWMGLDWKDFNRAASPPVK